MERRISFILLIASSISGFPQEGIPVMEIPFKYTKPYEDIDLSVEKKANTNQPWIVFSDRFANMTYSNLDSSATKKTIGFLEPFYVVEEIQDFIHIYRDENPGSSLSVSAEDFGWVKKENMLIWTQPIFNRKDIQKKAMILNTEEEVKKALEAGQGGIVKFYEDPALKRFNSRVANIYTIFFIYKLYPNSNNPTAALLGTCTRINKDKVQDDIWGWVRYSKLTPWDHRVALLPNTEEKAVDERKRLNSPTYIFCDDLEAKKFKNRQNYDQQCVFWSGDKFQKQYIGNYMRSPVLDDMNTIENRGGIMKVGFIGKVEGGETVVDQETYAQLQKLVNNLQKKLRSINIVFVIDGTSSMGPFFPKISEAVIQCMDQLKQKESYNEFRFAAVVYRDFDESERITESIPLTANPIEIAEKLKNVKAVDFKDNDTPEAVFYGLDFAMRSLKLPPDETNNLILIGDAGNHSRADKSQVPEEDIVMSLTKYNYNLFVFQVHNEGTSPYTSFSTQMRLILEKVALNQYENALKVANPLKMTIQKPTVPLPLLFSDAAGGVRIVDRPYIYGGIYYLNPNKRLTPEALRDKIKKNIISINDSTNALLRQVQHAMMGGKIEGGENSPILSFLAKSDMPPENFKILTSEHYQIYLKGFTPQTRVGMNSPLWEFQLFYTTDDLYELNKSLKMLIGGRTGDDRRKKFQEAWKTLLKEHIGSMTMEELDYLSLEEMEKIKWGLPGTTEVLKIRCKDITDRAKLSDVEFERWVTRIELNLRTMNQIYNLHPSYTEYSFLSNDQRYFWIPQRFLP